MEQIRLEMVRLGDEEFDSLSSIQIWGEGQAGDPQVMDRLGVDSIESTYVKQESFENLSEATVFLIKKRPNGF